jgi:hypothetical protein
VYQRQEGKELNPGLSLSACRKPSWLLGPHTSVLLGFRFEAMTMEAGKHHQMVARSSGLRQDLPLASLLEGQRSKVNVAPPKA